MSKHHHDQPKDSHKGSEGINRVSSLTVMVRSTYHYIQKRITKNRNWIGHANRMAQNKNTQQESEA
ncbi:MAG: hypothetical protein ACPHXR_06290 [Flavicella sp.]